MKVELTPYGRYKLSIGKLKPHHYRFFDNNVIYDGASMKVSEDQNDSDNRIRQETPILKQNPNVSGIETSIAILETDNLTVQMEYGEVDYVNGQFLTDQQSTDIKYRQNERQNKKDDHINQLVYNLGTIEYDSKQSPSYQVDVFRGELSSSTSKFYSSKNIQTSSIPQIDLDVVYEATITENIISSNGFQIIPIGPFADGTRIILKRQDPLIRIKETNAFDEKENFHITAYKISQEPSIFPNTAPHLSERLLYEKLDFDRLEKKIVSDLFVENSEVPTAETSTPGEVSYFFQILTDKDIAESDYCETIGDLPIRNIYLDNEIICPDQQGGPLNVYATQVRPEDLEDCD